MHQITTLDNQLRVVTVAMPNARSVCAAVYLAAGSRYESAPESGAAHFIEHMLFKGTKRRRAREIANTIERVGGSANAGTGRESTTYYAMVTPEHLPVVLDLLSDILLNSAFQPKELERERGVIIEEINRTLDTPDDLVFDLITALEWPDNPVGRSIAGTHTTVAEMSRAALRSFVARHYLASNAAVVVAGPVQHEAVVAQVGEYLGAWQPGTAPTPVEASAHPAESYALLEIRGTEQAQLCLSVRGVARRDPQRFAVDILTAVLGDGMGSRLFQEIRERRGLAYSVDASAWHMQDTGAFVVYAGVPPEKADEALAAIIEQLDRVRRRAVTKAELNRAKEYTKGHLLLGLETPAANAGWFGSQVIQGVEVMTPEQWIAALDAVTADDVRRAARRLFDHAAPQLVLVGPFQDAERFKPLLTL
ncbi:MAG TPA: pitrilysin family protein [Anaerolineae bacterium]|nr:pitrilysin family protein [Anaerolineae bacterium]HOQ98074.1 pitrilysin family protein [Anaerolineae bacterium]HPL27412.1 pitrilysin family protein [Anaerolineae bacterium]